MLSGHRVCAAGVRRMHTLRPRRIQGYGEHGNLPKMSQEHLQSEERGNGGSSVPWMPRGRGDDNDRGYQHGRLHVP